MFVKTTKAEYVGRTYKYGGDIRLAVENLELPIINEPSDPPAGATRTKECIWEKQVDEYVKRSTYLTNENIKTLYSLVWGQCTDVMRQKVEALPNFFNGMSSEGDSLSLLKAIKIMAFNFQSQKYLSHSMYESMKRFYSMTQGKYMTTQVYLEQFQSMVDVIDHTGGTVGHQPGLEKLIMTELNIIPGTATQNRDIFMRIQHTKEILDILSIKKLSKYIHEKSLPALVHSKFNEPV